MVCCDRELVRRLVGIGLLSLIPRLIKRWLHGCVAGVGVAGWNTSAACSNRFHRCGGVGLGTLLGPEETPVRVCSWWPFLAWPA